jgi:hypothetical protein
MGLRGRHRFEKLSVDGLTSVEIDDPANPAHIPFPRARRVR